MLSTTSDVGHVTLGQGWGGWGFRRPNGGGKPDLYICAFTCTRVYVQSVDTVHSHVYPSIVCRRGVLKRERKAFLNGSFAKKTACSSYVQPWWVAIGGWRLVAIGGWWWLVVVGGW